MKTKGFFNNTENDLRQITKIAYVKILLEQCSQKDLMSIRGGKRMKTIHRLDFFKINENHF